MQDQKSYNILDYHRSMVADRHRTLTLQDAIEATVMPNDVVLDLGCGSGILTCFALHAGAKRVYAVEMGPVVELARAVIKANGLQDRVVFLNDLSSRVDLPEKVDMIISETIGNFGLNEGFVEWVIDAQTRFLKPGGKIIPDSIDLFVAPLDKPLFHESLQTWETSSKAYNLDLRAGHKLYANNMHICEIAQQELIAAPAGVIHVELNPAPADSVSGSAMFQITRGGIFHGIGGWFKIRLTPELFLSNAPPSETPSWSHVIFPLDKAFSVEAGDRVFIEIHSFRHGSLYSWETTHHPAVGPAVHYPKQSTLAGQLLSRDLLSRQAGGNKPGLSADGRIALQVLSSLDGSRSLAEIATSLLQSAPRRFANHEEALKFVRDVSTLYGS